MSSAVEARPRVIRPGVLGLVALAVASLLALLFPGLDFGHPKYLGPPDELSIAYLEQVLRTHPGDRAARLLLARQQQALGHWDAAEASFRLISGGGDRIATQAELALLDLAHARLDAMPATAAERPLRQQQTLAALRRVAPAPLRPEQLSRLADMALALEAPADAAEIYERLAALDTANQHDWLLRAARWRRATGALDASVALYQKASEVAPAEWAAREDVSMAIEVLTAADQGARALAATDTALGRWPTDRRLLDRGVTLALARVDAGRAKRWSERLIQLGPDQDPWLRRHLDVELGSGDVATAFTVAQRLVARHPDDRGLRRKLAETAMWSGHPEEALDAWAWLASKGEGPSADEASRRTLALGHDLFDHGRVAEVLERKATAGTITLEELLDLSDALESDGRPERARAVLEQMEARFAGERAYWTERGEVAEHMGDLAGALAVVEQLQRRFGPRSDDMLHEVELLWAMGRPDEALAAARRASPMMTDDAVGFWRLYGDLAWSEEADEDAEASYLRLWALDQRDATVADRLVTLAGGRRHIDEVIRVGGEGFTRFASPALLVAALDAAADADRWDDVRHLVGLVHAGAREAVVTDQPGFWAAEGRLLSHDGNSRAAVEAFTKVVALSPEDEGAREDLMWARVDAALDRDPEADPDDGKPENDAGERLAAAIDRHDKAAVRAIVKNEGQLLATSEQVDAARELGDDERAWRLVKAAPVHTGDPDEDAAIAEHRRQLAEERLSGAWSTAGVQALGSLDILEEKARAALRLSGFGFEVLAEHARLDAASSTLVDEVHADEWRGGLALTLQEPWGDSRLEGGAYSLPTGALPYLTAVQRFFAGDRVDLEIEGLYHQLPTDSPALRVGGLRDVVEIEGTWRMGAGFALGSSFGGTRYTARDGEGLSRGWFARAELARTMNAGAIVLRPRVDGFAEQNDLAATLPMSFVSMVRAGVPTGNILPTSYATTGVGLTLLRRRLDDDDEVGSGHSSRGCAPCLRPFADVWTGWLMPAQRPTFSFEAGLGYLFLRHQELSASGFYFSDYRGEAGQHYSGASLSYIMRWL